MARKRNRAIKITLKTKPSEKGQAILDSLQKAVTQTLEKKLCLGHYAVTWRDGKPMMARDDAPQTHEKPA